MSMYSELLKIQKLRNEIITSLKTKLNTTEPLGLKDLSTKISGLSVGNQLIFASKEAGTYEIELKQSGTYEIVAVGGGGATYYFYDSSNHTNESLGGAGAYRKISVYLQSGKYQATVGKGGNYVNGSYTDPGSSDRVIDGTGSSFSDFLFAQPGQRIPYGSYVSSLKSSTSSNTRGDVIESIDGTKGGLRSGSFPNDTTYTYDYGGTSVYTDPDGKSWGGRQQDGYIRVTFIG